MNKKQIKALGSRYKAAYELVLNNYPAWKRKAINEYLANKRHGSFVDDFVQCVITQAEATDSDTTLQKTVSKSSKNKQPIRSIFRNKPTSISL